MGVSCLCGRTRREKLTNLTEVPVFSHAFKNIVPGTVKKTPGEPMPGSRKLRSGVSGNVGNSFPNEPSWPLNTCGLT